MEGIDSIRASSTSGLDETAKKMLGKDDFLRMLLAQLKNQDPLKPLDGTDFAVQLAQFSSLEQLQSVNAELKNLGLYQMTASNAQAVNLIGKEVTAKNCNTVVVDGSPVTLRYELGGDAGSVAVRIYNENGELTKTLECGQGRKGINTVTWECDNVPVGNYTFDVIALDDAGGSVSVETMVTGRVTAVSFKDNSIVLTVNGQDLDFGEVVAVSESL